MPRKRRRCERGDTVGAIPESDGGREQEKARQGVELGLGRQQRKSESHRVHASEVALEPRRLARLKGRGARGKQGVEGGIR
jgi:hypothetical protein